jgi:hypothetical protein
MRAMLGRKGFDVIPAARVMESLKPITAESFCVLKSKISITLKPVMRMAMLLLLSSAASLGQAPAELQVKLGAEMSQLVAVSTDSRVVGAVKSYDVTPPSTEAKDMTNEKWHSLTLFDPFVRAIGKSSLSEYLKTKRDEVISKIFVSGADGGKVGFDAKTEHWTHKGMPKHEVPMSGKTWIGPVKLDDSTGLQLIQVGLPVLDGGKPIGSIVFGLRADKLR